MLVEVKVIRPAIEIFNGFREAVTKMLAPSWTCMSRSQATIMALILSVPDN